MKVAYCSDLHIERGTLDIKNAENAEVLLLAGDIFVSNDLLEQSNNIDMFSYKSGRIHDFIENCCKEFPNVIMVCGNHESYGFDIKDTVGHIKKHLGHHKNFHLLDNSVIELGGTLFVGGTLWTDMNREDLETIDSIRKMMNDFRIIKNDMYRFTPADAVTKFKETTDYIDLMATIHDKEIVVVTHHAPSFGSVDSIYENQTIMNGGYCSDLENFIIDRKNIKYWVHGHLHCVNDYMVGDCNILSNPRGYANDEACADNFKLKYFEI